MLGISGHRIAVHSASLKPDGVTASHYEEVEKDLSQWKCTTNNFKTCLNEVVKMMVEGKFLDASFPPLLQQWIQALDRLGYTFPHLSSDGAAVSCFSDHLFHPIDYSKLDSSQAKIPINNAHPISKIYSETCAKSNTRKILQMNQLLLNPWMQFHDVLLMVVFNNPWYEGIPYIETLYRPFFPYMLYCGPGMPDFTSNKFERLNNFEFTFYSYGGTKKGYKHGAFNYECMIRAINMNFPVSGILFISDDTLLSVHKLQYLHRNTTWYIPLWDLVIDDLSDSIISWWGFQKYRTEGLRLLKRMAKEKDKPTVIGKCYRQLLELNGGPYRVTGGFADVYYVPKNIATQFVTVGSMFLEEELFLELAVPTMLQCVANLHTTEGLKGEYRRADRHYPWLKFTKERFLDLGYMYIHPTKWGPLAPEVKHANFSKFRAFFCDTVLPWMHDPQGKLPVQL